MSHIMHKLRYCYFSIIRTVRTSFISIPTIRSIRRFFFLMILNIVFKLVYGFLLDDNKTTNFTMRAFCQSVFGTSSFYFLIDNRFVRFNFGSVITVVIYTNHIMTIFFCYELKCMSSWGNGLFAKLYITFFTVRTIHQTFFCTSR